MLIRYPGSKAKLAKTIIKHFPTQIAEGPLWSDHSEWEYREPFFGAGAVGFELLNRLAPSCRVWLNDKDYGLVSLWQSVWQDFDNLSLKIRTFKPSVAAFNLFKEEDGRTDLDPLEAGFRKLALHQMSYSGLGAKSGGPLGGQNQGNSKYSVACRYARANLALEARKAHDVLNKFSKLRITCGDFASMIDGSAGVFVYLDPPYYAKGPELYAHAMDESDHLRLSTKLRVTMNKWVLSYDDDPAVRDLYSWATIKPVDITYTVSRAKGPKRRKNHEVLIMPTQTATPAARPAPALRRPQLTPARFTKLEDLYA